MPLDVPAPETLPDFKTRMAPYKEKMGEWYDRPRPIDLRQVVDGPVEIVATPEERAALAKRFAYERTRATGEEFGFHGVFNMGEVIGARCLTAILKQLEPQLVARNELWDLLRWALKRGQILLCWQVARRLLGSA